MTNPDTVLEHCDTLMLDMDGTLLDLAFDNHVWLELVPSRYACREGIPEDEARSLLYAKMREMRGQLEWYSLDYWSDYLRMDIVTLHREANHRIGYLPGARRFLEQVVGQRLRLVLVTNSHRETLQIKTEVTGVVEYFDAIYTSHDLGVPKEEQAYWQAVHEVEGFDPGRTLFIDDNTEVLDSARRFGLDKLLAITRPSTFEPARAITDHASIEGVADLNVSRP